MGVVDHNIGMVVLVLDEPDTFEVALYFVNSWICLSRGLKGIPRSPRANESGIECIHVSASEISKMATLPILRRRLAQYLQECMQKHIAHIESRYPQTMMLVGQKESGILGSEAGVRKRMSGVISKLERISFRISRERRCSAGAGHQII
jgi:hypothetical protein